MISTGQDKIVLKHRSRGAVSLFFVRRGLQLCNLLITAVIALAGVAKVGPDYIRPEVAVSQNWIDAGDSRVKSDTSDYRSWWKTFNDPVLDRLMEEAYQGNLSLRIAGGMISSTLLAIPFVPVFYVALERLSDRLRKEKPVTPPNA